MKSFYKRLITSVIVLIILALVIYDMNHIYRVAILLCSALASYEVLNMMNKKNKNFLYILAILLNFAVFINWNDTIVSNKYIFIVYSIILSIISVIDAKFTTDNFISMIFTSYFIVLPFTFFYSIKSRYTLILIFLIAISSDVFAYLCGSLFGKHKLIERISPNKTIEGSVFSYIITVVITYLYIVIFKVEVNQYYYIGLFLAPIVAQFGDLIFSKLKRNYDIKDYGYIFPGHGGVMDRFDSILMLCPFVLLLFF